MSSDLKREAQRKWSQHWRDENREHYRTYQREYQKKYRLGDIEKQRARSRSYYLRIRKPQVDAMTREEREALRLQQYTYYHANRKQICVNSRRRYAARILHEQGRVSRTYKKRK